MSGNLTDAVASAIYGLKSTQFKIGVTSDNIAGVSNPNYSRKIVKYDNGYFLSYEVDQITDQDLLQDLMNYTSEMAADEIQSEYFEKINTLFGNSIEGSVLSNDMENFISAWEKIQTDPSNASTGEIINQAEKLSYDITEISSSLENIDLNIMKNINQSAEEVNVILNQLDKINKSVINQRNNSDVITDLKNQRTEALNALSEYVDINVIEKENGEIAIYSSSGIEMLSISGFKNFSYDTKSNSLTIGGTKADIISGSLSGLINMRNDANDKNPGIINQLRAQLDEFVGLLVGNGQDPPSFNEAYNQYTNNNFFIGSDRLSITINPDLLENTYIDPNVADIAISSLTNSDRNFSTFGITISSSDYTSVASTISSLIAQNNGYIKNNAEEKKQLVDWMKEVFANAVGVNLDNEVANLEILQQSYNANAKVFSVISDLYAQIFDLATT